MAYQNIRMRSLVLLSLFVTGVFAAETDVVEFGSVLVGDSFTLHTNLAQIQSDDVIEWRFRGELTARISRESSKNIILVNQNRDRLELDNQTGNLKIRKVKITDAGLYKLAINGDNGSSSKTFDVTCVVDPSDGVKVVSVLDRDSVVLPTGLKISRDDQLTWRFEDMIIAQINQTGIFPNEVLNGKFEDRLQINQHTGSLTITNVRANTSGLYVLDITISKGFTTHKTFRVTTKDSENALTVMEGNSVTLESGIDKIHRDDVLMWRSEHEDSVIAKISNRSFTTSDGADGRFTGRLKLDDKTGSLTIRNIKTTHAGLYHLDITGNRRTIFKRFSLSICPRIWCPCILACVICVVLVLLIVIVVPALIRCGIARKCCGVADNR